MKRFCMTAALTCCALAGTLQAGSFGVLSSVGGGGQGCGASYSYTTPDGGSGSQSTTPSNNSIVNCVNTFTGPVPAGLGSAFTQAAESAQAGSAIVGASQSANADLPTGSLHAFASANGFTSAADAEFWDTLTFNIPGATDSTVTNAQVTFSVDGSISQNAGCGGADGNCQEREAVLQFFSGGVGCFGQGADTPSPGCNTINAADWAWSEGQFVGENGTGDVVTSWDVVANTADQFTVTADLSLAGADPVIGLAALLQLEPSVGTEDFSDTAAITFQLPDGVTFTSDSGQFDVAPEPGTFALSIGALLLFLGGPALRRCRRVSLGAHPGESR